MSSRADEAYFLSDLCSLSVSSFLLQCLPCLLPLLLAMQLQHLPWLGLELCTDWLLPLQVVKM